MKGPCTPLSSSASSSELSRRSILFGHLLAAVRGVGNELLASAVHDEIQHFERHLAEKIRDALRDLDHVKVLLPAHNRLTEDLRQQEQMYQVG